MFLLPASLLSQVDTREREAYIKSSDEYYFSQFLGEQEDEAKRSALDGLMYRIAESQQNAIDINTLKVRVKGIEYLTWPIGIKVKALAFVKKKDVDLLLKEKESLMVVPIEYTEAETINPVNEEIVEDHGDDPPAAIIDSSDSKPLHAKDKETKPEKVDPETKISSINPLLRDLLDLRTVDQLANWLKKNKYGGGIVSGSKNDFPQTEANCYIVIFNQDTNKILAVLTPNQPDRVDLKTGRTIISLEKDYKNLSAIWIQTL